MIRTDKSGGGGLVIAGMRKSFGKGPVVENISFTVKPGEFLTLLGPSGSGKSTTLMMIAGFTEPDSGSITLDDKEITGVPAYRRSIGVVFQSYALFPHMTVAENVAFALRMRDVADRDVAVRVATIIEQVRLNGLESRYPRQLSGGQQQRVALARALVFKPSLLLLDEPLGALDRLLREHMKLELRRIHRELGTSMIYVTHDQDEALVLSDRIAVMNEGKIEQTGTPDEIYERPASPFVARFIGESNFLRGKVQGIEQSTAVVSVDEVILRCDAAAGIAAGDLVDVAIRPEKITLTPSTTVESSNQGLVKDMIYHGEFIRYSVQVGSATLIVKQAKRQGSYLPAMNDRVAVKWSVEDALLFKVEPDRG